VVEEEVKKGTPSTYHADVRRSDKYWTVYVREVDRWTQARHLRELQAMTEDLIELMTGAKAGTFGVDYDIELPQSVRDHLARADRLRNESAQAQAAAAAEVRAAARELHEGGLPLRDVGQLLGISHQRAHQLVAS
jgi:hypothetical protein